MRVILIVGVVAFGAPLAVQSATFGAARSLSEQSGRPVTVRALGASDIPMLRSAIALATLVAIDPAAKLAEFRSSCGWYVAPKHKVHPGLWKVNLRGVQFEMNSAPGKASGYTLRVPLAVWEHYVEAHGWSGTLSVGNEGGTISNAGHTDICHGVLG